MNLKLLKDRNYAIGLLLVTIYGMLNFTPMVLLPPLLQQQAGFPDTLVGQVIGFRGVGMLVGFMAAGFMGRIDPRISMAFGFGLQTAAGYWMVTFDLNVTMEILLVNSAIQGFAVGVVWVPITAVAFGTLDAKYYAEASAIFHLLAQHRLELLHLAVDRRDRAHLRRQLQPHDRDDLALQPLAVDARRHRRLDL